MTGFPSLSYTSAREIPTLLYTWSLKKVPLTGRASPYRPISGVPPPRDPIRPRGSQGGVRGSWNRKRKYLFLPDLTLFTIFWHPLQLSLTLTLTLPGKTFDLRKWQHCDNPTALNPGSYLSVFWGWGLWPWGCNLNPKQNQNKHCTSYFRS